ncbi:hypothetical protein E2C01_071321 [Portunus trituberculatus]|uniref:Uncharacterized protein n=1 Tax=Portunus trituberculatus TaxID=210409 RepID=A0A5B7I4P1_PORTR|nr:hypothetical protein [Portunus trituberculatus]
MAVVYVTANKPPGSGSAASRMKEKTETRYQSSLSNRNLHQSRDDHSHDLLSSPSLFTGNQAGQPLFDRHKPSLTPAQPRRLSSASTLIPA